LPGFEAKSILIANPYGIGDILFTTPLVSTLRKAFPKSYIAYLVGSRTKEVLAANPEIDEIFVFDRDAFRAKPKLQAYKDFLGLIRSLRRKKFNLYFDLSNTSMYGFLSFILGIRWRIGFNYKKRGRFLNFKMPLNGFEDKHVIEYYLSLLDFLPGRIKKEKVSKFYLPGEIENWAEEFLKLHNLKGSVLIGIHPGGGKSWGKMAHFRWWPEERFFSLAKILIKKYQAKIIVFSEPREAPAKGREPRIFSERAELPSSEQAQNGLDRGSFIFPRDLSLIQFAALIKRIRLLISNDGGPLQIAVAVGTPTVSIFGPVSEVVYGPYPPNEKHEIVSKGLDCQPCYRKFSFNPCRQRKCLDELTENEVLAKVERVLSHKANA